MTTKSCEKVSVTVDKVELKLFENKKMLELYTVYQTGKIVPEPLEKNRSIILSNVIGWRKSL